MDIDFLRPELTEVNRLPSRPPLEPHRSADRARSGDGSPWRRSLDGAWRFRLVDSPAAAPRRWMAPATSDASWETIEVPGCWTRQDTGDRPHYTNIVMPWPGLQPPATPEHNPTGLHRTGFRIPRAWRGRQIVVHVGGAESVAAVWCNGDFVGMGKDSRLPSEFDVTSHLVEGENLLAVMVIRYSDATWIEDQDHWWHAGLHRSCHLEARGRTRIDDLTVVADYDPARGRGHLEVSARVTGPGASTVRVALETERGRRIAAASAPVRRFDDSSTLAALAEAHVYEGPIAVARFDELAVEPWSAEHPERYRVVTELLDDAGTVVEAHATSTGFRRVEVCDRRLVVNGSPIIVHGVNRHDHHPITGKTISVDEMRHELTTMKRHNINAVRTAHYPNDHRLLDLCDELGLYVIDEANVESHARWASLIDDPRYFDAIVERTRRMVARDKNHPCVIGWSLGNESGHGPPHDAAAAWVRAVDPTRFVHYEGALRHRIGLGADPGHANEAPGARERLVTDVVCPMYPELDAIIGWARWAETTELDDRPLLMCEYSHAMGNSNGSLTEYIDAFHREPALAGGFVWDWRDQGLAETDADGREYWAFGGHFGDEPNDANFCINGLVGPDGEPHPALHEYQWAARPVVTEHLGGRRLRITNRRHFTATDDLAMRWAVEVDGVLHAEGRIHVEADPGTTRTVTLPAWPRLPRRGEAHLTVEWLTRRRSPMGEAGTTVAWDQAQLRARDLPPQRSTSGEPPAVAIGDHGVESISIGDRPVVEGDIAGWLWRAPVDNDGIKQGWTSELTGQRPRWVASGLDRLESVVDDITRRRSDGRQVVVLRRRLVGTDGEADHVTRITTADDHLRFDERIELPPDWEDIPRLGVRFESPADLSRLEWFGPGPHETYPDRCGAATIGLWSSSVADQYHPYVVPQEHGAHVDGRWFSLADRRGRGFRVDAIGRPLIFTARNHHDADLTRAGTIADLDAADTIEVHVDSVMRGLGTGICGPDVLPPYRIRAGRHTFTWTVSRR